MADVSTETIDLDGVDATYNAASAGGDTFTPGERTFLHVKNGDASAHTVTVTTPGTVLGLAIANVPVSVPASGDRFLGPFPRAHFANSSGLVDVSWSATTSMTFAVLRT